MRRDLVNECVLRGKSKTVVIKRPRPRQPLKRVLLLLGLSGKQENNVEMMAVQTVYILIIFTPIIFALVLMIVLQKVRHGAIHKRIAKELCGRPVGAATGSRYAKIIQQPHIVNGEEV